MCTSITLQTKDHYFGRNLDLEYHYRESVAISPRNYPFSFRNGSVLEKHAAIIGMALVTGGYPLYYDATNEHGLSMAGLHFPGNAVYYPWAEGKDNITPFELIPWILGNCASVAEAEKLLSTLNLWEQSFSDTLPLTPMHWILADQNRALVMEPMADGLHIYENPVNVLTNNPPFPQHMQNLCLYKHLSAKEPENHLLPEMELPNFSRGMGAMGLPGDVSSTSRFVRAVFNKSNSHCGTTEAESVTQFFHLLGSVEMVNGCVNLGDAFEITVYSSCCNTTRGIYYYKTYENSQITGVDMHREDLEGSRVVSYLLDTTQKIRMEN